LLRGGSHHGENHLSRVDIRDSLSLGIRQKTDQLQTESGIQANRRQKPETPDSLRAGMTKRRFL
jgi:hypothetical protein